MLCRYTATYDAEKAAQAHVSFNPGDRIKGRLGGEDGSAGTPDFPGVSLKAPRKLLNLPP